MDNNKNGLLVNVGRQNPIHLGHQALIDSSLEGFKGEYLQILGSSNAPMSMRNFFSYEERRNFFKTLYPNLPVEGLPDYDTNQEWFLALDDLIMSRFDLKSQDEVKDKVLFLGGCTEDVNFFYNDGRKVEIVNRFDGTTPTISATEVRDALLFRRDLD